MISQRRRPNREPHPFLIYYVPSRRLRRFTPRLFLFTPPSPIHTASLFIPPPPIHTASSYSHPPCSHRLVLFTPSPALHTTYVRRNTNTTTMTTHSLHTTADTQACDWSVLTDYGSRSSHGSSPHTVHQLELPLRTTDWSSKNGKLAGITVPKPSTRVSRHSELGAPPCRTPQRRTLRARWLLALRPTYYF